MLGNYARYLLYILKLKVNFQSNELKNSKYGQNAGKK